MKNFSFAAVFAASLGCATVAQAQTTGSNQASMTPPHASNQQPGLAATTSDAGNKGTGASSAMIGTGNTQGTGVMSPEAPAIAGHGATGANPNNQGGTNNNQ